LTHEVADYRYQKEKRIRKILDETRREIDEIKEQFAFFFRNWAPEPRIPTAEDFASMDARLAPLRERRRLYTNELAHLTRTPSRTTSFRTAE
jgi:hypothetical protein